MKNTSEAMSIMYVLIYVALIVGIVLLIILGVDEFANVILPRLTESVNPF
ncbi:MAG: hypothetical protein R2824_18505 [Saprospiraceae bacterium]|nr:hypothetical protein [Lewinella sp.]